jgi:ribose transport system substrate-binding protein
LEKMKNRYFVLKIMPVFALHLALLLMNWGCEERPQSTRPVIAVVPKGTTHLYWRSVEEGARKAGTDLEVEILWKGPLKENDRAAQVALIEQLVTQGVDGIVLAPLDETALLRPVRSAGQAGIPVVVFDSGLKGEAGKDYVSFVSTDNFRAGKMAGDKLAELLNLSGNVGVLRYQVGSGSTSQREEGFLEAIQSHPEIKVLFDNQYAGVTVGETIQKGEELLDVLKRTDGIFCPTEPTTYGLLVVLRKHGLSGQIKMIGFDSSDELMNALNHGELHGLVLQDPANMAYLAVETLVRHLRGESVPNRIDTDVKVISR